VHSFREFTHEVAEKKKIQFNKESTAAS